MLAQTCLAKTSKIAHLYISLCTRNLVIITLFQQQWNRICINTIIYSKLLYLGYCSFIQILLNYFKIIGTQCRNFCVVRY